MHFIAAAAQRTQLLDDIRADAGVLRHITTLSASIVVLGAAYGASLGSWNGARLSLYAAIKVPLLMLGTAAITALFNWVAASMLGLPLRLRQTVALSLVPLAIASLIAASLVPVTLFFTKSLPPPSDAQRTLHNLLYLTHTILIAGAGATGTSFLRRILRQVCGDPRRAVRIHALWLATYAFVGGEVAWVLRPFVGSIYLPIVFLRGDALHGNVYEFIFTDILPHLARQLGGSS